MPSATLQEINASGSRKTAIIRTFEIISDAWPSAQLICNGFDNQVCIPEDGRTLTGVRSDPREPHEALARLRKQGLRQLLTVSCNRGN